MLLSKLVLRSVQVVRYAVQRHRPAASNGRVRAAAAVLDGVLRCADYPLMLCLVSRAYMAANGHVVSCLPCCLHPTSPVHMDAFYKFVT